MLDGLICIAGQYFPRYYFSSTCIFGLVQTESDAHGPTKQVAKMGSKCMVLKFNFEWKLIVHWIFLFLESYFNFSNCQVPKDAILSLRDFPHFYVTVTIPVTVLFKSQSFGVKKGLHPYSVFSVKGHMLVKV